MVNIKDFDLDYNEVHKRYPEHCFENPQERTTFFNVLGIIFARQKELMEKYHDIEAQNGATVIHPDDFGKIDDRWVQMRIKDLMQRCIEEMMEAANTLKNKPWKQDFKVTDREHFYEEIADSLHFFVEFCITAGLNWDDLFNLYMRKSEVNKFRQRSGY